MHAVTSVIVDLANGVRVAAWAYTAAQPSPQPRPWLVAVHGGALDHRGFIPLAEALVDRFDVLLLDLPGHGLSQPMPGAYSLDHCVDAVQAVADRLGAERFWLLGFSFGGVVAQLLAARSPARVLGLVIYASLVPSVQAMDPGARDAGRAAVGAMDWAQIESWFVALCSSTTAGQQDTRRAMAALGLDSFRAMMEALFRMPGPDTVPRLGMPLLYVHGADDASLAQDGFAYVARVGAAYPDMALAVIPGAGHCAHLDQPEAFSERVGRWLIESSSGTAVAGGRSN